MQVKSEDYFHFGLFGETALDFLDNSNHFINIAYGSIRSGKTITCLVRWLKHIQETNYSEFLMAGKTSKALERNCIVPLRLILSTIGVDSNYSRYNGVLEFEGNTCYCIGLNDESSVDVIAGMTVGGFFSDESARCPQSSIEMAISRCSVDGAKCFLNCNPESPYHYLYQNYIDNDELLESGDVGVWHFTLEDNPNLPQEYIDELKRVNRKSPVFYKRNILGEWVVAEGAVYPTFDESENVFYGEVSCDDYDAVNICCDYGVSTVTTFGVMGIKYNEPNEYYLLEETYYDAEETGIQQSDSERVEDILKLQDKYGLNIHNTIFLPHDAASLKVACEKDDRIRMNIETYMPDTYGDIEVIQDLITNRKLKIHESCTNTIRQIQTYSYDIKAQRKGEDRVVKENDHCPDMIRGGILGPRKRKSAVIGYVNI